MASIVTDQFRINNAKNFVDSVKDSNNSYYVFFGLSNPTSTTDKFGRYSDWPVAPVDNFEYLSHYKDTILFGKKVNSGDVRRVIRRVDWTANNTYEMYRHDYSITNQTAYKNATKLYNADYYVVNSDYRVYICLYNGIDSDNPNGRQSLDEPTFTDLEPAAAGSSGDGYIWKYLFTISPSDIIKFDSTEYIILPNDWGTSTDPQIKAVREAGDSTQNNNQIKIVHIEQNGEGSGEYVTKTYPILGDGSGGEVLVTVTNGKITDTTVTSGGSGYTYGIVDLETTSKINDESQRAKLVPIIPPSKGHGYDIYSELGADRVLIFARFDDSIKEFITNTQFSQVGILKNPESLTSSSVITTNTFSNLHSLMLDSVPSSLPAIGGEVTQIRSDGKKAKAYVAGYDSETNVLKYYQDRSLYYLNGLDSTDGTDAAATEVVADYSQLLDFDPNGQSLQGAVSVSIDDTFNGTTMLVGTKRVSLGVNFSSGIAKPEINNNTGDVLYIDNRSVVTRNIRQKEDVKIILEF